MTFAGPLVSHRGSELPGDPHCCVIQSPSLRCLQNSFWAENHSLFKSGLLFFVKLIVTQLVMSHSPYHGGLCHGVVEVDTLLEVSPLSCLSAEGEDCWKGRLRRRFISFGGWKVKRWAEVEDKNAGRIPAWELELRIPIWDSLYLSHSITANSLSSAFLLSCLASCSVV